MKLDLYRVRRTLTQVKGKLEEALRLSLRQDEVRNERQTDTRRHR